MATAITSDRVVNGSYGELWLDGEKMAEVYGLDAQMEVMKAEVPMCGINGGIGEKYTGWNGTGSLGLIKFLQLLQRDKQKPLKKGYR